MLFVLNLGEKRFKEISKYCSMPYIVAKISRLFRTIIVVIVCNTNYFVMKS